MNTAIQTLGGGIDGIWSQVQVEGRQAADALGRRVVLVEEYGPCHRANLRWYASQLADEHRWAAAGKRVPERTAALHKQAEQAWKLVVKYHQFDVERLGLLIDDARAKTQDAVRAMKLDRRNSRRG